MTLSEGRAKRWSKREYDQGADDDDLYGVLGIYQNSRPQICVVGSLPF